MYMVYKENEQDTKSDASLCRRVLAEVNNDKKRLWNKWDKGGGSNLWEV